MLLACLYLAEARFFIVRAKGGFVVDVLVNGKAMQAASGTTVSMLIEEKGLNSATIVVEYNQSIIRQDEWQDIVLKPGDCLEIITFVGGG